MERAAQNIALSERFAIDYRGKNEAILEFIKKNYHLCSARCTVAIAHTLKDLQESDALFYILIAPKESDLLLQAIEFGVDHFLCEPVEIFKLQQAIEDLKSKFYLRRAKEYNVYMLHQYKNAIDSSNIVSKTDVNGVITYVNEEFCKISGYSKEELVGKNHNVVRHPDVPKERFEQFWKTILAKKIWKGTVKNLAKDGSTFYVNTTVVPITDYAGNIVEFVAIRYDVTESVELEQELERRVAEQTAKLRELNLYLEERIKEEVEKNRQKDRVMFQQSKLASLGEMLGNIAHQWRQPLMELAILLYKIKDQNPDVYKRGVAIVERMNQTIIDFQNFFRPDKVKERFSLIQTIKNALAIMEGSLEKEGIEVELRTTHDAEVWGYKNEFAQVVINLLSNAKDALKGKEFKKIVIEVKVVGEEILIEIIDNAGGIEENILDKIFEPYFTTKHASKGTGLGLYMSKMIVEESMGGRLWAENMGSGAKFTIALKRGEDGVQPDTQESKDTLR